MEELFDLGMELSLDDLEGCTVANEGDVNSDMQQTPDLFDGKFDISFFGLIPNTIIREDDDVLSMLIQISLDVPEARNKINSLLRELDVFVEHIERKLLDPGIPPTVDITIMNELYDTLYKKVLVMKEAAKELTLNSRQNLSEQLSEFFTGDINILASYEKVSHTIAYIIGTDKFDKSPQNSIAIDLAERYKSLITSTNRTHEIIDSFSRLKEIVKNSTTGKYSSTVNTLIKLTQFSSKSYFFTDAELAAMEYLGFPYQVAGYELYFKSSPIKLLEERATKLSKSKSKVQESIKQIEANKEQALAKYSLIFTRKGYLCKENSKAGVNASCLYF